ncbi:prolyl oligopeptidase family serine peptidase [Leucobacter rhizosphaerae]|uniref:Prolyl oligopeptidase family serine peptidase n=1 Tax=Leucobacter rhizosphaerae TaxID=2932245 RepID=A0ABY4FS21_9MICO|nr:prolyl oligopeptidase family serine peptidase [Leucobacter rhizosphaerae]UOQ59047.1 prolyl oligopeptidase family serine peptidase [Leucobacter rhizosphaerae]
MTTSAASVVGPPRILRTGPHDDQVVECWDPATPPRGTAVLIHGGYWRSRFTAALMHPLVPEFTARGWSVANLEYRRGADGWAALHHDLGAALDAVRAAEPSGRLAIVGHSVGGQLALLGARPGDAVVALAPVTDLARGLDEGIGDGAVAEFFGSGSGADPDPHREVFAAASPRERVPPAGDVLVVHGADDARVPIAHTRAYVEAARAAGGAVELLELPRLSHLDAIDPAAPHWPRMHTWLDRRMPPLPA